MIIFFYEYLPTNVPTKGIDDDELTRIYQYMVADNKTNDDDGDDDHVHLLSASGFGLVPYA